MKKLNALLIAATLIFSISASHATSSPKLYSLKGDTHGSKIPSIDAQSTVPFNKRFDALTSQQQNLVKAKFDHLGVNDTPPFPVSGLKAVYKPLVKANKVYGDNSTLNVTATVSTNGTVTDVKVHNSNNVDLVSYIERNLQHAEFQPASCNGVACEMNFPIEISFN